MVAMKQERAPLVFAHHTLVTWYSMTKNKILAALPTTNDMTSQELAVNIIKNSAEFRKSLSEGRAEELGVGFNPTPEDESLRRAQYAQTARHLAGPLARKASRATTSQKWGRLVKAANRHCSSLAAKLSDSIELRWHGIEKAW